MKRKNVHIVMQAKGGVGKTFISWIMGQFLREKHPKLLIVDTDPTNQSLSIYKNLKPMFVDFLEGKRNIEVGNLDKLFDLITTSEDDLVIDTGSSSFVQLNSFLALERADEVLTSINCNVFIHVPIVGGESRKECLAKLSSLIKNVPNAMFIAWINNYPVPVFSETPKDDEPVSFEDTEVFKENKKRFKCIIVLPAFPEDTTGKTLKLITKNGMTFDDFYNMSKKGRVEVDGISVNTLQVFRCNQVKKTLWECLRPLDTLERYHSDQNAPVLISRDDEIRTDSIIVEDDDELTTAEE